ncbi:ATP-binding protein [Streptomyces sp. H27-C3]|uniref:tetratricopeptide repeat protein n=1 Tax=Streptomyces sp. H27-C3 TaxID=3046305 RepID=UPI0024B974E8|nr:ATP-binding protein [Streptomyces sp. H27-C3]MDJ0460684.1 tetratricopeptide repeat protein [Streptomyces sp. H27-C3]
MTTARPSMQELIRRRRRAGFVGRRDELAVYRANFDTMPDDERHRFLFHIHGNAGVGKTSLVRELEHTARERKALTAYVDENVNSVPEAMAAISAQFAQQGKVFKAMDRLLATYRQRRHEAESASMAEPDPRQDPAASAANPAPSAGSLAVAQAGLVGLGMVPGVGAFAGAVDPAQVAQGTDRLRMALSARFGKQEDVQLVLDPLQVLTPVLVAEVERAAADAPWIALFFDTYERTGPFLDTWLRDLVTTERYGALPAHTVVTLAGQPRLDPRCWADCVDFVEDLPLEPFTESEARQLLSAKGVVEEAVVQDVLRLSGRLPVLVSTLAENPGEVNAPSATAVDRFLKWEQDPVRRAAALACALPRRLNEDIFAEAVEEEAAGLFGWLGSLPFVTDRGGGARYHDVVRAPMLRLQRTSSPQRWTARHTRLAEAFARWRDAAGEGVEPDELWEQEDWRELRLQEVYHLLCAQPQSALPGVLRDGVDACDEGPAVARRWARTVAEAGEDADAQVLRKWGQDCLDALSDEQQGTTRVLGLLLARAGFDSEGLASALVVRGHSHLRAKRLPASMADYDRAVALDPAHARAYFGRGLTHLAAEDHDRALADIDRADALAPDTSWIIEQRGETLRHAERFDEAVAELDRAIELDPASSWALASRGQCHQQCGRYAQALADFDRAIELDPEYVWALVRRAHVRRQEGDSAGALADLERAAAVSPEDAWVCGERAVVYRLGGRTEEALAAYGRAIELDPEYAWAYGSRGLILHELGRSTEGLADLDRAIELDADYVWALIRRSEVRRGLGDEDGSRADMDRALRFEAPNRWVHALRAEELRLIGRYEEALTDFDRAIALVADDGWALAGRGQTLYALGRCPEALADLDRAAELLPDEGWILAHRGALHLAEGRLAEAVRDLGRAVAIDPDDGWALARRARAGLATARLEGALADLERCLELAYEVPWTHTSRAEAYLYLQRPAEALEALAAAERAGPLGIRGLHLLAETHRAAGRFGPAAEAAERLRAEDPGTAAFHDAMLASRTEGPERARDAWRAAERLYPYDVPGAPTRAETGELAMVACALGEWQRAGQLLDAFLEQSPPWDELADTEGELAELLLCPGADTARLEPLHRRVAEAKEARTPG